MIDTHPDRIDRAMLQSQNVEVDILGYRRTCVPVVVDLVMFAIELNR